MKNDVILRFDLLSDMFGDGSDQICKEDVNLKLHDAWRNFLEAGCDATRVSDMMSAQDVWEHYGELLEYGADINLGVIYEELSREAEEWDAISHTLTIGSLKVTLDSLRNRGASDDLILESGLGGFYDVSYVTKLLSLGVDVDKVWAHCGSELLSEGSDIPCNTQYELFCAFRDHNCPVEKIKAWVDDCVKINSHLLDDLFVDNNDDWTKLGIDLSDYIDMWLQSSSCSNIGIDNALQYCLPECITQERYIGSFSADELVRGVDSIEAFYNGDADAVAKIILDAIGYPDGAGDDNLFYMYCILLDRGSKLIDRDKLVACIKASTLSDEDKEGYYGWLNS